jgi:hypothetical protein
MHCPSKAISMASSRASATGLQPCAANYLPYLREADWAELPGAHPTKGLGISDDKAITTIRAERRAPEGTTRYEVFLSW